MDKSEIAAQLTLKAIECDKIHFLKKVSDTSDSIKDRNEFNCQQIIDFFNKTYKEIDK